MNRGTARVFFVVHTALGGVLVTLGVLLVAALAVSLLGFGPANDCAANITTIAKDQSRL